MSDRNRDEALAAMIRELADAVPAEEAKKGIWEEELPPPCEMGPVPEQELPDGCLMQMLLPVSKRKKKIWELEGKIRFSEEEVSFDKLARPGEISASMRCRYNAKLMGILFFLHRSQYTVDLSGNVSDGKFCVYDMHIVAQETDVKNFPDPPFYLTDELFQVLLRRSWETDADAESCQENKIPPAFSAQGELRALYSICKSKYPANIQVWAEQNFAMLSMRHLGGTDKRHILKALAYLLNVEWSAQMPAIPDSQTLKRELDGLFYGLEPVKQQILEIAAQIRKSGTLPKWGILLNGPAGIGKTSIANAIAKVFRLPKAYVDFSAVKDDEALSGSSRIYDNGKPGLILEQIYAHRSANLVMVLNEIDKAVKCRKGNPLDTLLSLLDRTGFTDTYIETGIPTTGILFVATCNEADKLSRPLLDRFCRIDIPAYSQEEKEEIFNRFVLPAALKAAKVNGENLILEDPARAYIFRQYAVEPGARDLERVAEKLVSNYLLRTEQTPQEAVVYTEPAVKRLLGPAKTRRARICMCPGTAMGAFAQDGTLRVYQVQVRLRPGTGTLKLVNIPGDDLKDFCRMAYEFISHSIGRLSQMDVVLGAVGILAPGNENYIGNTVCAAIFSAISGTCLSAKELFLGGCDLFGNMYFQDPSIDPYLKGLSGQFHTIYAPIGSAALTYCDHVCPQLHVIETPTMSVLLELLAGNRTGSQHENSDNR